MSLDSRAKTASGSSCLLLDLCLDYLKQFLKVHAGAQRLEIAVYLGVFQSSCCVEVTFFSQGKNSPYLPDSLLVSLSGLLADAEAAEDSIEQVVGVDGANHFAEFVQRAA